MSLTRFTRRAVLGFLVMASAAAHAADNELYDAPPPDDAAFLRWIEPGPAPDLFGVAMQDADHGAFHPVSATVTQGALAGAYYTAARNAAQELVIIEEPARADRTKVHLTLLNLSGAPVRLMLPAQGVEVIAPTAADSAKARAVNPVAVSLSVMGAEDQPLGHFDLQLRRGQNVTFVARPGGAEMIENRFGPNLGE